MYISCACTFSNLFSTFWNCCASVIALFIYSRMDCTCTFCKDVMKAFMGAHRTSHTYDTAATSKGTKYNMRFCLLVVCLQMENIKWSLGMACLVNTYIFPADWVLARLTKLATVCVRVYPCPARGHCNSMQRKQFLAVNVQLFICFITIRQFIITAFVMIIPCSFRSAHFAYDSRCAVSSILFADSNRSDCIKNYQFQAFVISSAYLCCELTWITFKSRQAGEHIWKWRNHNTFDVSD